MAEKHQKVSADIIYTKVDEAPELASGSLLPIIRAFLKSSNITIDLKDISLSGRILAKFPSYLGKDQIRPDDLNLLGEIVKSPGANVIKLPNISASVPQLNSAIAELRDHGFNVPEYPESPETAEEQNIKDIYLQILGSAVNPVLREGNSDRRVPYAVKEFAKKNPHSMGNWSSESKTHVSTMGNDDFFSNETSVTVSEKSAGLVSIQFVSENGKVEVLKDNIKLEAGDVVDATMMSKKALRQFITNQIEDAKNKGILFSLHLKSTMMKVSDPIIFGHVVSVFFDKVFSKYDTLFAEIGVEPKNGLGELLEKVETLDEPLQSEIKKDIQDCMDEGPDLYMVDSTRGITNLHVPSDVIIDASMPALIRGGGKGWDNDGNERDAKCVIPDSSYAALYDETIEFCKENGAFNPSTMGTVSNVGLMAKKAQEYGSHPQTFVGGGKGAISIIDANGSKIIEHSVEDGDIWRMCLTRDTAIRDWVKLAVDRASSTGAATIFWLNEMRSHDAELIKKVHQYLEDYNTDDLKIEIMSPREATRSSLTYIAKGEDTVSVTGNVLRDYITDLFPIMEVGTSAKMLSIVPLMNGGKMFETGAGGSAPKHVQQMISEGHLRWDSLGEFCAIAASLEFVSEDKNNTRAGILAKTLNRAIEKLLDKRQSPSRKLGEIDNRGSHFYLALYWAQEIGKQEEDKELQDKFLSIYEKLLAAEQSITDEMLSAQGQTIDLGGYYDTQKEKVEIAMRPSPTFTTIIDEII